MSPLTRRVPFSVEPRRPRHEREESNPVRQFWRLPALPGAHSCDQRVSRGELNPHLPVHNRTCRRRYTTDTMSFRQRSAEGAGVEPARRSSRSTGFQPVPVALRVALPFVVSQFSSPTRSRTRNASFEARHDVRFTIELCAGSPAAEGGGIEPCPTPLPGQLVSNQCPEPVRLPSVRVDPPGIEPGSPPCHSGVVPLDHEPVFVIRRQPSGPDGSRTHRTDLARISRRLGHASPLFKSSLISSEVHPGIEPGLPPYQSGVLPETPADRLCCRTEC
jgi:hypothetical protein